MRYSLFIFLFLGTLFAASAQSDNAVLIQQAEIAYTSGDYKTAQVLYEQVVQSGVRDPAVFFNLGNAYYQAGDLGNALLNYRIVQQYWPRDSELNRNLALVRAERIDLQGEDTGFVQGLAALTISSVTLTELSILVGCLWTAAFLLLALAVYRPEWRGRLRSPLFVLAAILLIGLLLLGSRLYVDGAERTGIVVQPAVQVKSGPGDQYLEIYQLHAAAELHLWDTLNGWVRFALPDGRLGWLPAQAIEVVGEQVGQ